MATRAESFHEDPPKSEATPILSSPTREQDDLESKYASLNHGSQHEYSSRIDLINIRAKMLPMLADPTLVRDSSCFSAWTERRWTVARATSSLERA